LFCNTFATIRHALYAQIMMKTASRPLNRRNEPLGELALIDLIRQQTAHRKGVAVRLGIGDDCAILSPPRGHEVLVTTDFSLETRHFRRDLHPPESIGHRCLARGLSDLAAMGAKPLAAFLSLALPSSVAADRFWIGGFLAGFEALAALHNVPLAGGDTAESPSNLILADICLVGSAPRGKALRRSTAHAGDDLYITGALGGAAAELLALQARPASLRNAPPDGDHRGPQQAGSLGWGHPHLYPQPRLAVGQALLRRNLASACIDVSDGLSTDLAHLCTESNLRAEIDAASLPLHPLCAALPAKARLKAALHGGEDYEFLFTAAPSKKVPSRIANVAITKIGSMHRPSRTHTTLTLIAPNGSRSALQPSGWEHFRNH
jgi:thiamine-monophosphate kinase